MPVAVVEDDGLHALVPVVFFDANSDSEVVACAESRVWANEDSVTGVVVDWGESCREFPAVVAKSGHAVSWLMSLAGLESVVWFVEFAVVSGEVESHRIHPSISGTHVVLPWRPQYAM